MSTAFPTPENNPHTNPYTQPAQPTQPAVTPTEEQRKKKGGCMKWGGAILGAVVLLTVFASFGGDDNTKPATDTTESSGPEDSADTPAPASPAQEEKPAEADVPREYKNALRSAERYLDFSAFSYQGLYDQLTSKYGDKFPPEAAQYAIDNLPQ